MNTPTALAAASVLSLVPAVHGQLVIDWHTIDGGGGTSSGGGISITGTIGQHDAATSAGGGIECAGGFWPGMSGSAACYPNCDGSTISPVLSANDFICFIARYAEQNTYANCDQSTSEPTINANDFICFINAYFAGCS